MIKLTIFSICLSYVWVFHLNKTKWIGFKPFTCEFCMAGWFAALLYGLTFIPYGWLPTNLFGLMATAMVGEFLLNRVIDKL